jgi:HEPN domain-containing protein
MVKTSNTWFNFALRDLRSAKKNYEIEEYQVTAFLTQQAVEKALKALLIKKTENFPKIHDLTRLAKLLNAPEDILELCARITPAYTATRYPDISSEFSKEEVKELVEYAEKVIEWVEKELKLT